jgi:hypothetical protein
MDGNGSMDIYDTAYL